MRVENPGIGKTGLRNLEIGKMTGSRYPEDLDKMQAVFSDGKAGEILRKAEEMISRIKAQLLS